MKYSIRWLEYHHIEEIYPKKVKKIAEEILSWLPENSTWEGDVYGDGTHEFECIDYFEAENIEEAKKKAVEYDVGENNIFSVYDSLNNQVFTDEDVEGY